jgi:uncharacterized RDD family membrane protein YckC
MLSSRRSQRSNDSRLIEFPRKSRQTPEPEVADAALPQWRQDLNEKVRAIRARRNNPAMSGASTTAKLEEPSAAPSHHEARKPNRATGESAAAAFQERSTRLDDFVPERIDATPAARNANPIVEKALSRVRRASENARREYLPKIEPAKPARPSYTVENQATARALEPAAEITRRESPVPEIKPTPVEAQPRPSLDISASRMVMAAKPLPVEPVRTTQPLEPVAASVPTRKVESYSAVEPVQMLYADDLDLDDIASAVTLDEIEPVDYLEAEIRKVDRTLTAELHRDARPSRLIHLIMGAVDLSVIALSALPFIALVGLYNGDFGLPQTRFASVALTLMIAFFYLALTQSLCGRTFGMMITNTRLIDDLTAEPVTAPRAIVRTVGCFIAAAPAGIGLLWAAFSPQRRGWQDYLAGTRVISDF